MKPASPGTGYRLLSTALIIFWILHALRHGLKHRLSSYAAMRMPILKSPASAEESRIWMHASSVGEVQSVTPLVEALLSDGQPVLFTSFTASGYQAIQRNFGARLKSSVIPIDFYWFCRQFFRKHPIRLGLVMETELWPELLYQAQCNDIPLILVNARLSEKSLGQTAKVRRLLANTINYFSSILTRSQRDQVNLLELGAAAEKIEIIGNLKRLAETAGVYDRLIERDYMILASSHDGEEFEFLKNRRQNLNDWLIVIAPRHPDRSQSIQAQMDKLGVKYAVRSKAETLDSDTQVYLADTLGELKPLMAHARVVIMGGSFNNTGGHNLLEAASLGRATITGPSDSNIIEDIQMLGNGDGILQVSDMQNCWLAIEELIQNTDRRQALISEASRRLAQQPDIVERYMNAIKPWL